VTFRLDVTPTGLMRLASGLVTRTMRTEVGQLERLKEELKEKLER